jgi:hypothetical protein
MKEKLCPFLAAGILRGGDYDPAELASVAKCVGEMCMLWYATGTSATPHGKCAIWSAAYSLSKIEAGQG